MKIGTVLRNEYVADDSPLRYAVYVGCDSKYIHTIYPYNGKIEKGRYYKQDVGEGREIHPVGYTDVIKQMIKLFEEKMYDFKAECESDS